MARRPQPVNLASALYSGLQPLGRGPSGRRASAEAKLQYVPQLQALLSLLGQTRDTGRQNVQQIRRGGLLAAGAVGGVRNSFIQQLADTPAPTGEAAAHLGLTKQAVAGELANMQANQYTGINAGVQQARHQTQSDLSNIVHQLIQTQHQGGLYNTSQFEALAGDARKAHQQAAQAQATLNAGLLKAGYGPDGKVLSTFDRLHPQKTPHAPVDGVDYQTYLGMSPQQRRAAHKAFSTAGGKGGKNGRQGKPAPGTSGSATQSDYTRFQDHFGQAQNFLKYVPPHMSDVEAVQFIQSGIPANKTAGTPAVKGVTDQAAAWAAWEMHKYHAVSSYVAGMLHKRGYVVKRLGFPHFNAGSGSGRHAASDGHGGLRPH